MRCDTTLNITDRSGLLKRYRDIFRGSLNGDMYDMLCDYGCKELYVRENISGKRFTSYCCISGSRPRSELAAFSLFYFSKT